MVSASKIPDLVVPFRQSYVVCHFSCIIIIIIIIISLLKIFVSANADDLSINSI